MDLTTAVRPISYLKSHAADIVLELAETREPMLITQNGEAKMIVMDVVTYQAQQDTMAMLKLLAIGNQEIADGKYQSLDDFLGEVGSEL